MNGGYGSISSVALPAERDPRKQLRVSDAERRDMVQVLRHHFEEGRLSLSEYEERTEQAYSARVYADFEGLVDDLPVPAGGPKPPVAPRQMPGKQTNSTPAFRAHLNVYLVVSAFLVFVWAFTSRGYFWPAWPMAGWGIALVLHWLAARSADE